MPGSRLEADHPEKGVLFACRFTFLAAVVRKKLGLKLESEKTDGERVYRIVAREASGDATGVPSA